MAMAVIRKVEADLWLRRVMNMSKHRENRVSDFVACSTGVESFTRTDLSLRIQSPPLSIYNQRCQKARRTSSDETDDSQLNA